MKKLIFKTTHILIIVLFASQLFAQFEIPDYLMKYDELIVVMENGNRVSLKVPLNENLRKNKEWRDLLSSFQEDLKAVVDNIPDYDFFEVEYAKGESMSVKELIGEKHYILNKDVESDVTKRNACHLNGKTVQIEIHVQELTELLDPNIIPDINNAISQQKRSFFGSIVENTNQYDVSSSKFLNIKEPAKFIITGGVLAGAYRGEPITEVTAGLGVRFGEKVLTFQTAAIYGYDKELQSGTAGALFGLQFFPSSFSGIEFMVNPYGSANADPDIFKEHKYRISLLHKYKSIIGSLDYYLNPGNIFQVGFKVGYGF